MKEAISTIYGKVVQSIISHSHLTPNSLFHSRKWADTTGRIILILTLLQLGISEPTIKNISGMSQQRVNYIKNLPASRISHLEARLLRTKVWNEVKCFKRDEEIENEE